MKKYSKKFNIFFGVWNKFCIFAVPHNQNKRILSFMSSTRIDYNSLLIIRCFD